MTTGEMLRALRREQKLTQKKLSEKSNIPVITIQQYERGVRQPKIDKLVALAKALDVPVENLISSSILAATTISDEDKIKISLNFSVRRYELATALKIIEQILGTRDDINCTIITMKEVNENER